MNIVFADSFYFVALLNPKDAAHARASAFANRYTGNYVCTSDVLTEFADCLSRLGSRALASQFIADLPMQGAMKIVWSDERLFWTAHKLYASRPDKEWSLTDCISFVVMTREGITEALTGDHHFEQAGFAVILK